MSFYLRKIKTLLIDLRNCDSEETKEFIKIEIEENRKHLEELSRCFSYIVPTKDRNK